MPRHDRWMAQTPSSPHIRVESITKYVEPIQMCGGKSVRAPTYHVSGTLNNHYGPSFDAI